MGKYSAADIEDIYSRFNKLRTAIDGDSQFGFDLNWPTFCKIIAMLSIKARGARLEKRIVQANEFTRIRASENRGDFKTKDGRYIELKASILTVANKIATIRGIRPWQDLTAHLIIVIDLRREAAPTTYTFWINDADMGEELISLKASPVSGTKEANKENNKSALGFNLKVDPEDEHFRRWREKYEVSSIKL